MAYTNLPPNLQDIFNSVIDRISKLETGPNSAAYTADYAQTIAISAQGTAVNAQAIAATSLQKNAYSITNASNQLTAINGSGITVYAGAQTTSGSRVLLNSQGIVGFNSASTQNTNGIQFVLSADNGSATFWGPVISAASITGSTILGGTIGTNNTGNYVAMTGSSNSIDFYTGGVGYAHILPTGAGGAIFHYGTSADPASTNPQVSITAGGAEINYDSSNRIYASIGGAFLQGTVTFKNQTWSYTGTTGSPTPGKIAYIAMDGVVSNSGIGLYYSGSYGTSAPPNTLGDNGDYLFSS